MEGGLDQDGILDFFGLRFDKEREEGVEGGVDEGLPEWEQAEGDSSQTQYHVVGTHPFVMGGWAQWNRIYYLPKGQKSGLVMLLVERVGKATDQNWTCVDPSLRVQIVCLKDKKSVFAKPTPGITWAPFPGLTERTRDTVIAASQRLIARRELDAGHMKTSSKVSGTKEKFSLWKFTGKKKSTKKESLMTWLWTLGSNVF